MMFLKRGGKEEEVRKGREREDRDKGVMKLRSSSYEMENQNLE